MEHFLSVILVFLVKFVFSALSNFSLIMGMLFHVLWESLGLALFLIVYYVSHECL